MSPEERGIQRTQLSVGLLEEAICENAFVRVLDLFADRLGDLSKMGFSMQPDRQEDKGGAPACACLSGAMTLRNRFFCTDCRSQSCYGDSSPERVN